jgi:outer membrane usher protein
VDFGVRPSNGALIKILVPDGTALPAGSTVRLEGQQKDFVSAPGGEVYLTGLRAENVVTAYWSGKLCKISLHFKDGADPMPNLGDFKCVTAQ